MAVGERPYGVPQHEDEVERKLHESPNGGRALLAGGKRLAPTEAKRRLVGVRSTEQSV